jgi:hypothetical protein
VLKDGKNGDDSVMLTTWNALPMQAGEAELLARLARSARCARESPGAGNAARSPADRIVAAGRGRDPRQRCSCTTMLAALGDDLRLVLICSKATLVKVEPMRRRASAPGERVAEVRALLALARGRRRECRTSRTVRALRQPICMVQASAHPCLDDDAAACRLAGWRSSWALDQLTKLWVTQCCHTAELVE